MEMMVYLWWIPPAIVIGWGGLAVYLEWREWIFSEDDLVRFGTCKHCRAWLWHRDICFTCGRRQ